MQRLFLKCSLFLLVLFAVAPLRAQLEVSLTFDRHLFLRGEPVEAKVTIRNMTGHDITLKDAHDQRWFSFEVTRGIDHPVGAFESTADNLPLSILTGETVERKVNLLTLYPVNELGTYKVRMAIYFHETQKYLSSRVSQIDISEGKTVFRKTVGVPEGKEASGEYREISLITFQKPNKIELYARVEDQATGSLLATYPLGRILSGATPMGEFDDANTLFIMHMNAPSQYALSRVGVNGEWLGQALYASGTGRATVRKKPDGTMVVVGASRIREDGATAVSVPKLSDRPVALPPAAPKP